MIRPTIRGRVEWAETDASGAFHYTHAFRWAEAAETELWRRLDRLDLVGRMPRRAVEAELLRPLSFDDEYDATLWPDRLGRTSITWAFEVSSRGVCHVRGQIVVVYVDAAGRATLLPDDLRQRLVAGRSSDRR